MSDVLQSTLKSKLQTVIDNYVTGSTSASNVLNLALSVWALNEPNILVVDRVGNLPYLEYYTSPNSVICFISDIGVFAISSNMRWITLDGRLLRDDQNLLGVTYSWGLNSTAQLGDNTLINRSSPVSMVGNVIDWCNVSAGYAHSAAVRTNGTAWSWGAGDSGRLGDNTTVSKSSPVSVVGGFTDWCQVSGHDAHTVAVRQNGTAWAWGAGASGRLGNNAATDRSSPVSVVGGFSDWCQASAGCAHTVAVRTSGSAWAWGTNNCGQLGDNTLGQKSSPVSVVGGFSDWCQASASNLHTVAVRTGGSVWAWGRNQLGVLGNNTTTDRSSPVSVVGGFSDWCQVSARGLFSVAVRTGGSAWAWGYNGDCGRLGDNTTENRSSPVSVVGGFSDWCQAGAGLIHSVAVRTNSTAWSWGRNVCGALGDNTTTGRSSPVSVMGGFSDWCEASAGRCFSLGIRSIC